MLTIPSARRRPPLAPTRRLPLGGRLLQGGRLPLGLCLSLALAVAPPALAQAQASPTRMPGLTPEGRPQRPDGFVLLEERGGFEGIRAVGVFGARPDPGQEGLWRVQVWEEVHDRVTIATDKVSCRPSAPLRITGRGRTLIVRQLNPGGPISPANRLDHQIWWAVCHPALAGRDPGTLGPEARRLGFDGRLIESEQLLPGP
jgi:hypothetical protein